MQKKYYFDLDNTLCLTNGNDYKNSIPIKERINYVNKLKSDGNTITIWTARGSRSGVDYKDLTIKQLTEWNVIYDKLLLGKPDYDIYIDDKSFNVNSYFNLPIIEDFIGKDVGNTILYGEDSLSKQKEVSQENGIEPLKSKKDKCDIVEKGWGKEIIFANNDEYCGKILCFDKGKRFSMHYHLLKKETWYVAKGKFILIWIDITIGITYTEYLNIGDVITNERGEPHQLIALENSEVFEVSTKHFDSDSYRIKKGD